MQNDNYFKRLLVEYYNADTIYLKKKYKCSFREIYQLLEKQEKDILELQGIILELETKKDLYRVVRLFKDRKNPSASFREFKLNLFLVDTSQPINKKIYETSTYLLRYLKREDKPKWKQLSLKL